MGNKKKNVNEKPLVFDDDLLDTCKAASATDCTGIIQSTPMDDAEYESYRDVYDFTPPFPEIIDEDEFLEEIRSNIMVVKDENKKSNTSKISDDDKKYLDISDVFDYNDIHDIDD